MAAIIALRSGDLARIRAALREPPRDPLLIGALIPLLEQRELLRPVIAALTAFGPRAAGQLVDRLLDPATPEIVRRRLPLVLKSCASSLARDGLIQGLSASSLEVRLRCGRALLALTDRHPELIVNGPFVLSAVERELADGGDPGRVHEHVFNLLGLALEREPVHIAARAFESDDAYLEAPRSSTWRRCSRAGSSRCWGRAWPCRALRRGSTRTRRRCGPSCWTRRPR